MEPMLTALFEPLAVSCGHSIYVFGGFRVGPNMTTQEYDAVWGRWTFKADMPVDGCADTDVVALNGHIFLVGGNIGGCFSYNPALDTWSALTDLEDSHISAPAVVWQGKILVGGGINYDDDAIDAAMDESAALED